MYSKNLEVLTLCLYYKIIYMILVLFESKYNKYLFIENDFLTVNTLIMWNFVKLLDIFQFFLEFPFWRLRVVPAIPIKCC